jgi:hypothetical protein
MKPRKNKGVAMLAAIVVVVIVMGLGLAFMGESIFRSRSELTERHHDDGLRMCDAAIEQARRFLFLYKQNNTWAWDDILQYCHNMRFNDEIGVKADYQTLKSANQLTYKGYAQVPAQTWPEAPVPSGSRTTPSGTPVIFGVFSGYMDKGAWYMTIRDNSDEADGNMLDDTDDTLVVSVTSVMMDGVARTVEARVRFEPPTFTPQGAIVTNGTANLAGNMKVMKAGTAVTADVISNGSIIFTGNSVTVEGSAMAFGTITGAPSGVESFQTGTPKVSMPIGDPAFYKPLANYILKSNGSVQNSAGAQISPPGASFYNFSFGSGSWSMTGDDPLPPPGVYYLEGDFDMTGKGTFNATLIVEGSVNVRGTGVGWNVTGSTGGVTLIAGTDIKINGNATINGVILANEQMFMNGNATINGAAVALDKGDTSPLVSTTSDFDDDEFGGSARINYPGPQSTFLVVPKDSLELVYTRRIK